MRLLSKRAPATRQSTPRRKSGFAVDFRYGFLSVGTRAGRRSLAEELMLQAFSLVHDRLEHAADRFAVERAVIGVERPAQYFFLPDGFVDWQSIPLFDSADLSDTAGALVE